MLSDKIFDNKIIYSWKKKNSLNSLQYYINKKKYKYLHKILKLYNIKTIYLYNNYFTFLKNVTQHY